MSTTTKGGKTLVNVPVPALKKGKSATFSRTVRVPDTAGSWKIIAVADPAGRVKESSERNNTRSTSLRITTPAPAPSPAPVPVPLPLPAPAPAASSPSGTGELVLSGFPDDLPWWEEVRSVRNTTTTNYVKATGPGTRAGRSPAAIPRRNGPSWSSVPRREREAYRWLLNASSSASVTSSTGSLDIMNRRLRGSSLDVTARQIHATSASQKNGISRLAVTAPEYAAVSGYSARSGMDSSEVRQK